MPPTKQEILQKLQEDILPLQGYRPPTKGGVIDAGLGTVGRAFPNGVFPTGAVHEFLSDTREDAAATDGFVAALLGSLMRSGGVGIWISTGRQLFPPALKWFGVDPEKIVFVDLTREKDAIWAMEEALKGEGPVAVIGEIREIDLTASRKLQLAVEKSRVTGFLLRHQPKKTGVVAAVARWRISAMPSLPVDGMPGLGFPRWKIELLKVRNGLPGEWIVEWVHGGFRHAAAGEASVKMTKMVERRKTG